jgi:hypothetical protein
MLCVKKLEAQHNSYGTDLEEMEEQDGIEEKSKIHGNRNQATTDSPSCDT